MYYWINHGIVSIILYLSGAVLFSFDPKTCSIAPIMFYAGREIRDIEKLGFIDWLGIISPILSTTFMYISHKNILRCMKIND